MIRFEAKPSGYRPVHQWVYLDRKMIGTINETDGGFKYIPKGKRRKPAFHGDVYATIDEVQLSLYSD